MNQEQFNERRRAQMVNQVVAAQADANQTLQSGLSGASLGSASVGSRSSNNNCEGDVGVPDVTLPDDAFEEVRVELEIGGEMLVDVCENHDDADWVAMRQSHEVVHVEDTTGSRVTTCPCALRHVDMERGRVPADFDPVKNDCPHAEALSNAN